MAKLLRPLSLRTIASFWILSACFAGGLIVWVWMAWHLNWQAFLDRAHLSGMHLYQTVSMGAATPEGLQIEMIADEKIRAANGDLQSPLPGLTVSAFVTEAALHSGSGHEFSKNRMAVIIASPILKYPIAEVTGYDGASPAVALASVTRVLARYCGTPVLFLRKGSRSWYRIDGSAIWGCDAGPSDYRLIGTLIPVVFLLGLLSWAAGISGQFRNFSSFLRQRRRFDGPTDYQIRGSRELIDMTEALNRYLKTERNVLEKRASVLSGVSHDLGTPATRLRLRTSLIEDRDLRQKLDRDIDEMTGMIESVLTYTRSEMNEEAARQISLTSLISAIVNDYQETGQAVQFDEGDYGEVSRGHSIFAGGGGKEIYYEEKRRVLVTAKPVSLQRAISNLIDNALKYGRRATVFVDADVHTARINVEDAGGALGSEGLDALVAPFQRGANSETVAGFGLGLTIVATIADQHNGTLRFERGENGLRAILSIARHP